MNWTDIPSYLCLAIYALATVASLAGVLGRSPRVKKTAGLLCVAGFALHTLWLLISIADGSFSAVSRGFYLLPLSWILALAGLLVARRQHMDIALHFVAPWAFFLGACALGFSGTPGSLPLVGPLFILHLAAIFVGVGVMPWPQARARSSSGRRAPSSTRPRSTASARICPPSARSTR